MELWNFEKWKNGKCCTNHGRMQELLAWNVNKSVLKWTPLNEKKNIHKNIRQTGMWKLSATHNILTIFVKNKIEPCTLNILDYSQARFRLDNYILHFYYTGVTYLITILKTSRKNSIRVNKYCSLTLKGCILLFYWFTIYILEWSCWKTIQPFYATNGFIRSTEYSTGSTVMHFTDFGRF